MLGSVSKESSDSGSNHSIEGYAGDVSSEGKVSSTSLCVGFKNMEIAGTEDEIVHVVGYGVVGEERIVKREDMWEWRVRRGGWTGVRVRRGEQGGKKWKEKERGRNTKNPGVCMVLGG